MILNRHFHEFIGLLEKHGIKYLVVGGYAVGLHGFPRYTGDLDIFVAISRTNASGLIKTEDRFNRPPARLERRLRSADSFSEESLFPS